MSLCRVDHPLQSSERMVSAQTTLCHLRPLFREWGWGVWVLEGLGPLRSFFKPRTNPSMITKIRAKSVFSDPHLHSHFPAPPPGAVDEEGRMPFYAEECASMLAVTFSGGDKMLRSIVSALSPTLALCSPAQLLILFPSKSVSLRVCPCW